ncbi:MAG: hypothetical protein ACRDKU_09300, partial [Gaiellaceae bacterium]
GLFEAGRPKADQAKVGRVGIEPTTLGLKSASPRPDGPRAAERLSCSESGNGSGVPGQSGAQAVDGERVQFCRYFAPHPLLRDEKLPLAILDVQG